MNNIIVHNLFFVNSPLQLLCAVEATYKFKLNNSILIIFNKGVGENFNQLTRVLEQYASQFHEVVIIDRELKSIRGWLKGFREFENLVQKYQNTNYIFIGDFNNGLIRHFCNSVIYNKLFIVDDGFATIKFNEQLTAKVKKDKKDYLKWIISGFKYKNTKLSNVVLFTFFNNYIKNINIVANEMSLIVNKQLKVDVDCIYWLGSPIVEDGIVSLEYYKTCLMKYSNFFSDTDFKIVYIPHRRECKKKLENIKSITSFELKFIDYPIEMLFLFEELQPQIVISFFSTALFTLNKLLKETDVYYIDINETEIMSRKKHVENIYEILRKEVKDIKKITLK